MKDALVEDLMVPLSEYPSVTESASLAEALGVLEAGQEQRDPDRQPHRAVLVQGSDGRVLGKLGHFAVLKALLHPPEEGRQDSLMRRAGVGEALARSLRDNLSLLSSDFGPMCERAGSIPVGELLAETVHIDARATLAEAARSLLDHGTLSLLVTREGRAIGVLRLSDVFEEASRRIRNVERRRVEE